MQHLELGAPLFGSNSRAGPKPYVVYWNNIPSPYMVERFNALADSGRLDFEAWFNDRLEPGRSWKVQEDSWRFRYRYLTKSQLAGQKLLWPTPAFGRRPDVMVSLYAEPVFLLGWFIVKLRGGQTAFWCAVTRDRWVRRKWWKNLVKRAVFPIVDATLSPGPDGQEYAMKLGTPANRAQVLQHVVDVDFFSVSHRKALNLRDSSRRSLGLRGTTFVYVGRLWWGKGIDYLLDAFEIVQQWSSGYVSLLLVGDGPDEEELKQTCRNRNLQNVIFAGFRHKEELPRLLACADVFVFPTLGDPYGLVVDEAMACSLPVISTSAAGEIHLRVEDGVNGFVVQAEESTELAKRMLQLSDDKGLRDSMGRESASRVSGKTPTRWAHEFEAFVFRQLDGRHGPNRASDSEGLT